jgi:hypothetical protein
MLSFTLTILRIGSQECWDKATATLNNSMFAGVVYQLLIHQPSKEASRTFSTLRTRKVRERSRHRFWKRYVIRAYIKAELRGRRGKKKKRRRSVEYIRERKKDN